MPRTITSTVQMDECTTAACAAFDVPFDGTSSFTCHAKPDVGEDYSIGLIVGPSGTGKSQLLSEFGSLRTHEWNPDKAIVSHFRSPTEAMNRLMAVGLNSIPAWLRPCQVLSTGERFRADLARDLMDDSVVDEFTSTVDRNVAKAASSALRRYADKHGLKRLTLATCHYDVIEWLRPDWYYDTATGLLHDGRLLRRPRIELELHPASKTCWRMFASHHYLTGKLHTSARCYIVTARFGTDATEQTVGFLAALSLPHARIRNAWREHRLVILPDFQGLGIGVRASDMLAEHYLSMGKRWYSRTAHVRLISYRDASPQWRLVSRGRTQSTQRGDRSSTITGSLGDGRPSVSHEFVGSPTK